MANLIGIDDLGLEVNDEQLLYVPNTLKYAPGSPEATIKGLSSGGALNTIATRDVSTGFGIIKFTLPLTEETALQVRKWDANGLNGNTVAISGNDTFILIGATLMNKPEFSPGVDSEIEIEFHGAVENS